MDSRIEAWRKLTDITGPHRQLIELKSSTTKSINARIKYLRSKDEQMNAIQKLIKLKKKEENKCSVCYERISDTDKLKLECNHIFHLDCIKKMFFLYMDDKCPLCRKVYKYTHMPNNRKSSLRLKKKILNHYKNECNRISLEKIMEVFMFLDKRNINLNFLSKIALTTGYALTEKIINNYTARYVEIYNKNYYYYYDESCKHTHAPQQCNYSSYLKIVTEVEKCQCGTCDF